MITNEVGEVSAQYEYSVWGRPVLVTEDSALVGFPMRFVGAFGVRTDELTGLVYMRARHYDPQLARFLSRDPIGTEAASNLYSYASNDPSDVFAPIGLVGIPAIIGGIGLATFAYNKYSGLLQAGDDAAIDSAVAAIRRVPGYSGDADYIEAMHSRGALQRIDAIVRAGGGRGLEGWTNPLDDYVQISGDVLDDPDCPRRLVMLATILFHEAQHKKQKDRDKTFIARKGLAAYGTGDSSAMKELEKPAYTAERQFLMDWLAHVPSNSRLSAPIQARLSEVNNRLSYLR